MPIWAWGAMACLSAPACTRQAEVIRPEPNLNVLHPRVILPILRGRVEPGTSLLACAVAAGVGSDTVIWDSLPHLEHRPDGIEVIAGGRRVRITPAGPSKWRS